LHSIDAAVVNQLPTIPDLVANSSAKAELLKFAHFTDPKERVFGTVLDSIQELFPELGVQWRGMYHLTVRDYSYIGLSSV
jgi:voltage-gated potassium channel Kch